MENKPKYQELADKWAKETGYDRAIFITQEDGYEVYFRQSMDPKFGFTVRYRTVEKGAYRRGV